MDRDELIRRLTETFLEELKDHVRELNQTLLALEANPMNDDRARQLGTLFRTAHNLKGAGRAVNLTLIEEACHQFESVMAAARDGDYELTPADFPTFFAFADGLEQVGDLIATGQSLEGGKLDQLYPKLETIAKGCGPARPSGVSPERKPVERDQPGSSARPSREGKSKSSASGRPAGKRARKAGAKREEQSSDAQQRPRRKATRNRESLRERLMATFLDELDDHVKEFNSNLLALESDPQGPGSVEAIGTIFRTAHNLKGASRAVDLKLLEDTCHQTETIMAGAKDGWRTFAKDDFTHLFKVADALQDAGRRIRSGEQLEDSPLAGLQDVLARMAEVKQEKEDTGPVELLPESDKKFVTVGSRADEPSPRKKPRSKKHAARQFDEMGKSIADANTAPTDQEKKPADETPAEGSQKSADAKRSEDDQPATPSKSEASSEDADKSPTIDGNPPKPRSRPDVPPPRVFEATPEQVARRRGERGARAARGSATLRVAAEKLDSLFAQNSELLVTRSRMRSRVDEISDMLDLVMRWRNDWQRIQQPLNKSLMYRLEGKSINGHGDRVDSRTNKRVSFEAAQVDMKLRQLEKDLDGMLSAVQADTRQMDQICENMDHELRRLRMLPFLEACTGLPRAVRDVAAEAGKDAELIIEGDDVELDRSILEGLKDPLLHLVRNAVDHGLELPEEREAAGKPKRGKVWVSASLKGDRVLVTVRDNGKGVDLGSIRRKAEKLGYDVTDDGHQLLNLLFESGFTTARKLTKVSGRGVGLDVVRMQVERLHGTVDIQFSEGQGTTFTLTCPLTVSTLRALIIEAGGQPLAIPSANVDKLMRLDEDEFSWIGGREVLITDDGPPIAVAWLSEILGLTTWEPVLGGEHTVSKVPAILVSTGEQQRVVFVVDRLIQEQEVVVMNLGSRIGRLPNVTGATLLPSGELALVLSAMDVVRHAIELAPNLIGIGSIGEGMGSYEGDSEAGTGLMNAADDDDLPVRRLVLADDSLTTRSLVQSILESGGYEVLAADDGDTAWKIIQENDVDLVVSDVEMPRMNGFNLTKTIRASDDYGTLPVVLVTSLKGEEDQRRGIEAGADAYLIKSSLDQQNLLGTIDQLLCSDVIDF